MIIASIKRRAKPVLLIALVMIITGTAGCSASGSEDLWNEGDVGYRDTMCATDVNNSRSSETKEENQADGNEPELQDDLTPTSVSAGNDDEGIDIDLTQTGSTMAYALVYDMVNNGDDYIGKTIKVSGSFSYFKETDDREFFAVVISDATACCSRGIEFVPDGDYSYPDDFPAVGTEITVVGKFSYYKEDPYTYCQLTDAIMTVDDTISE